MPSKPQDVLLVGLVERARSGDDQRRNAIGWYANVEISEREFQMLGVDDFLHLGSEILFLAGKRLRTDGRKEAQVWWARPFCPECGREGIVEAQTADPSASASSWKIDCCGSNYEGSLKDVCLSWMGRLNRHPRRAQLPERRLEEGFAAGGGTDWESQYQKKSTPWDRGGPHPEILRLAAELPIDGGSILVPGCGRGHDAAALARHLGSLEAGSKWSVTGLDLSSTALTDAVENYHSLPVEWVQGDLFALARIWGGRFDWIIEHTCVSGLPPELRDEYLEAMAAYLREGGSYLGVFLCDTGQPPEVGPPFAFPQEEILARFEGLFEVLQFTSPEKSYLDREAEEMVLMARRRPA